MIPGDFEGGWVLTTIPEPHSSGAFEPAPPFAARHHQPIPYEEWRRIELVRIPATLPRPEQRIRRGQIHDLDGGLRLLRKRSSISKVTNGKGGRV